MLNPHWWNPRSASSWRVALAPFDLKICFVHTAFYNIFKHLQVRSLHESLNFWPPSLPPAKIMIWSWLKTTLATRPVTPLCTTETVSSIIIRLKPFSFSWRESTLVHILLRRSFVSRKYHNMQATSIFREYDLACFCCLVSEALEFMTLLPLLPPTIKPLKMITWVQKFSHAQYGSHFFRINEMTETSMHG